MCKHAAGDTVECYVTFEAPADLDRVQVEFHRQGEGGGFVLGEIHKLDAQTYKVRGAIPPNPSGTYMLASIVANRGKAYRLYEKGFGLGSDIVVEIEKAPILEKPPSPAPQDSNGIVTGSEAPHFTQCNPALPNIETIKSAALAANPFTQVAKSIRRIVGKNRCGGEHPPGDRLTCYLQFSDPVELSSLFFSFDMEAQDRGIPYYQRPKDQRGLCTNAFFDQYKKVDSRTYQVSGLLPACGSGRYVLEEITAYRAGGGDRYCPSRAYTSASDIKNHIAVYLQNAHQTLFPDIMKVSPSPIDSARMQ